MEVDDFVAQPSAPSDESVETVLLHIDHHEVKRKRTFAREQTIEQRQNDGPSTTLMNQLSNTQHRARCQKKHVAKVPAETAEILIPCLFSFVFHFIDDERLLFSSPGGRIVGHGQ